MNSVLVNAVGDNCPIPVVKAKNALSQMKEPGVLEIHVDNETAVQNLTRFASSHSLKAVSEKAGEKLFIVKISVDAPVEVKDTEDVACLVDKRGNLVVAVDTSVMGRGNDELGALLMKGFIFAVSQLDELPKAMLFYNGGVKLTVEGSPALEDLKNLEAQGVEIMSCGTCLNFYGLTEQLAVGTVTNMYSIVETLANASSVIKP